MTAISKRVAAFLAGLAVLVSGQASFWSAAAQELPSARQPGGETVSFDTQQYPSYTAYRQQHEDVYPDAGICLEMPIERIEREDGAAVQAEEVLDVRWASADEVLRLLDEDRFVPYNASFLSLLYDIHTHGGGLDLHRNAKMK